MKPVPGTVSGLGERQRYLSSFSHCAPHKYSSVGSTLCLLLGGVRCAPKRARIDAIWIEFEHCVIELARVHGCFVQAVESAKVLPGLGNDAGSLSFSGTLCPATTAFGFRASSLSSVEIHSSLLSVSVSPR